MKVALTGAAGHLGSAIIPELFKRGHQVRVLVRDNNHSFTQLPVVFIKGDILNTDSVRVLLQDCDALIHCAAVISVNGDPGGIVHRTNVEGTKLIMDMAKQAGIKRVIHISSIHAYEQRPSFKILDEQSEKVEKGFAYDHSKKAGQEIALSMNGDGMEVLVMNPTSIVGPYDFKPSKVGKVIIDLYSGRLPFVFDGGFDFCDCRDVAHAIANALTMGKPGENYLLAGKWYSFKEFASFISKASGKKIKPVALSPFIGKMGLPIVRSIAWLKRKEPVYTHEGLEAIISGNRNICSNNAISELHYNIRPFEETIADAVNWFRQNGYLV